MDHGDTWESYDETIDEQDLDAFWDGGDLVTADSNENFHLG